jgi:hypothetical protein
MTALRRFCGTLRDIIHDSPKKVLWKLWDITFGSPKKAKAMSHSVPQNIPRAVMSYVP